MSALEIAPPQPRCLDPYIERLRAENAELLAENEALRRIVGLAGQTRPLADATRSEQIVVGLLMRFEIVSREQILAAFEANQPKSDGRTDSFAYQVVFRLRRKLAAHGMRINAAWGRGYSLSLGDKERLRALTANQVAPCA